MGAFFGRGDSSVFKRDNSEMARRLNITLGEMRWHVV